MTLVGWCPGGRTTKAMLDTYQGTSAVRVFVQPNKPMPAWDGPVLGPLVAAGVTIHVSYKTNSLAEVLAWAALKPAGLPLKLTKNHEPEQQRDGDPTPEQFHAAWAELVPAFDGAPMRDEIWLGPVYTRFWWQANPGDRRWMPRQPVDFVGWDIYNNGLTYRTADDLLSIPRAVAAELGVPYLVAELGATRLASDLGAAGQRAWMRAMVDAISGDGVLTCCWYHKEEWDLLAPGAEPGRQEWQAITLEEAPVATTAPPNLLAVRNLMLTYLNVDKGSVRANDLEPAEVGIVGNAAHRGGYHCGADRVVSRDYSVVESSRDRTGLDRWACALDVGTFKVTTRKGTFDLPHYSRWLVAQCEANTADTRDIREVIYSPDGKTVKRWDRLGKRTSGDNSHLYHTHQSYFRDAIRAGRDQTAVVLRYLTEIGLIEGDDDMPTPAEIAEAVWNYSATPSDGKARKMRNVVANLFEATFLRRTDSNVVTDLAALAKKIDDLSAKVAAEGTNPTELTAALAAMPKADTQAIVAGVLAGLPAEKIAAAIPPQLAQHVADELSRRLAA